MKQDPTKFSNLKCPTIPNQALDMTALKNGVSVMKPKELANILNLTAQGRTLKNVADSKIRWNFMTKMAFGPHVDKKASEKLRKRVLSSFAKNDWGWLPAVVKVKGIGNNIKKSASINMENPAGQSILLNSDLKGSELSNYFFQEIGNFFYHNLKKSVCISSNRGLRLASYLKNRMAPAPVPQPADSAVPNDLSRISVSKFDTKAAGARSAAELHTLSAAQINRLTELPQMAVEHYLDLAGNRSGAQRIQDALARKVLKVEEFPCRGVNQNEPAAVKDLLSGYYAKKSDWFTRFSCAETNYENPEVHLRPSVVGRHKGIAHDAYIISGYSGTTRYRDKAIIAGAIYGKAVEVVSDSEAMESLALAMADLVRHCIHTAGSDVDAPPKSLLNNVKDNAWTVIEVECRKHRYTGITLLDRKGIDTIGNAIKKELRTWWQSCKAKSACLKNDVGTPNPSTACKKMETALVEDAARMVSQLLDKQYQSAAHPITDPSRIDRLRPGQIVQAFEENNTAIAPSTLLEVVSECYRRIGGLVTFEGLDAMLASGRYDEDKFSPMDRAAFDDMAQAFALSDNYNQTTMNQKRERFVRALCWDLGYTQAASAMDSWLIEKKDDLSRAIAHRWQANISGQEPGSEPPRPSSHPKTDNQAVPTDKKRPAPAFPESTPRPRPDESNTADTHQVSALRAFVNIGLKMIDDYLSASSTKDLEAYRNIIPPISADEAISYMTALHHRDKQVSIVDDFSGKLQKAIEKASATPRTYTESGDLTQDCQRADFISRLAAAYHLLKPRPANVDTTISNQTALHQLLGKVGISPSDLSIRGKVAIDDIRKQTSHPPIENQPAVIEAVIKDPGAVLSPGSEAVTLGKELVRFVANGLQSALKAANTGTVVRMAMAMAAISPAAAHVAAAAYKMGGILARGAKAVRKLLQSDFVEESLDESQHVTERLKRIVKVGATPSSGGGTDDGGRDSESNNSDVLNSDTARKGATKASAKTVAQHLISTHSDDAFLNGIKVGRIKWVPTQLDGIGQVSLPTVSVDIDRTPHFFFVLTSSSSIGVRRGDVAFARQTEFGKNEFIPVDPTTGRDLKVSAFMTYPLEVKGW
jgi:hypothetical protein